MSPAGAGDEISDEMAIGGDTDMVSSDHPSINTHCHLVQPMMTSLYRVNDPLPQ